MKIDAKELALRHVKHSTQKELGKEGERTINEVIDRGAHIDLMASMIEAIHKKDSQAAHEHMMAYSKAAMEHSKPSEPQKTE